MLLFPTASTVHIEVHPQGLDTEAPQMVTSTGVRLAGAYEDSLGSLLFFLLQQQRPVGAAPDQSPQPGKDAGGGADSAFAAGPSSLPQQGGEGQLTLDSLAIDVKLSCGLTICPEGCDMR